MDPYTIVPTVNAVREFIEIAKDFANPLDLVREAISNAHDAGATGMSLDFRVEDDCGERTLVITMVDNGRGMDRAGLQAFFDLGNSTKHDDPGAIGEKGHGTKIFLDCRHMEVRTTRAGVTLTATVDAPFRALSSGRMPAVPVTVTPAPETADGTTIVIRGYANNRRDRFTHALIKDHIRWFTKVGSIEPIFHAIQRRLDIRLRGLGSETWETIGFGHHFPNPTTSLDDLLAVHVVKAPDHFCGRHVFSGNLRSMPEIGYEMVISIEGNRIKHGYNEMLRRPGYQAPEGAYTIQERYGLWFCKDHIPVQRRNDLITSKGSEYTRVHAFINCQALKLTANRGSVDNTPSEIMRELEAVVREKWDIVQSGDDWRNMLWLEEEAEGYNTVEKEKADLRLRTKRVAAAKTAVFLGATLTEPQRESGVVALLTQIAALRPDALPFVVLDYDTHEGIDLLVKANDGQPLAASRLHYVEVKHRLSAGFNHSFANVHSIVCWDIDLKIGDLVRDITGADRKLTIVVEPGKPPSHGLDDAKSSHRIAILVMKDWLHDTLGIAFAPRADAPAAP